MASRFAVPTLNTLTKYRAERDVLLTQACINYNNHGDARTTMSLLAAAREKHRKVLWARDYLHQRDTETPNDRLHIFSDEQVLDGVAV